MSIIEKSIQKRAKFISSNQSSSECPDVLALEINSLKNSRAISIRQTSQSYQAKRKKSLGITTGNLKRMIRNYLRSLNPVDQPTQKNENTRTHLSAAPLGKLCKKRDSLN